MTIPSVLTAALKPSRRFSPLMAAVAVWWKRRALATHGNEWSFNGVNVKHSHRHQKSFSPPYTTLSASNMTTYRGISLTKDIAGYMKQKFRLRLHGSTDRVQFPNYWSMEFLEEVNLSVEILVMAYRNQSKCFW